MTVTLDPNKMMLLPDDVLKSTFPPNSLFGRMGSEGSGSCFFHSVCMALNTRKYLTQDEATQKNIGIKFRRAFINHITNERWETFKRKRHITDPITVETLIKNFNEPTFWANETMIKFVSDVMKLNIIFIDMSNGKIYCGVRGKQTEPLIMITWLNKSHFEPVFRVLDSVDDKVLLNFMFDMQQNADVVDAVMSSYKAQCS